MKPEIKKYLYDINVSINSIFEYLGDRQDFNEYQNNKQLRRAVERELEIIGEAMKRALSQDSELEIENARRIVDTRNWVIHWYDKVDNAVIWGIVVNHLPKLHKEIQKYL